MGWFWADPKPAAAVIAPHPAPSTSTPSPVCPMHKSSDSGAVPFPPRLDKESPTSSSCPVRSPNHPLRPKSLSQSQPSEQPPPSRSSTFSLSKLNPLNYMPSIPNTIPTGSPQSEPLPLTREPSSIPRADSSSNWEYPSPQQMYNAMLRKGYTDTPVDAVESMVAVHNFLNEGAWAEIEEWERIFSKGLLRGWEICSTGEEGIAMQRARSEFMRQRRQALNLPSEADEEPKPKLLRFQGRPSEPTPKARMLSLLGKIFPDSFSQDPPFDRHDWYVSRTLPNGQTQERRYVIDYYGGGVQETGEPVFYLDIRPALDTPSAAIERAMRWGGDVWHRASGGAARAKGDAGGRGL